MQIRSTPINLTITIILGLAASASAQAMPSNLIQLGSSNPAQIVALDECEPSSFNMNLGADFCKNVALGATTSFDDLFTEAMQGNPDPKWDFEPDSVAVSKGTMLSVVNQGGEPHTFTEVKNFGGGFVDGLNHGQNTVPECAGGFANIKVARTRILQGSRLDFGGLSKGKHFFQCCIHPWMRVEVDVK